MKYKISAKTKPLFGTGLWDDQDSSKSVALLGGYFAAPDPKARSRFVGRYQKNYGTTPVRLATLAYDATALAAVLTAQGRGFDESALTSPAGFAGIDGIFRINSSHVAERGLAVMQVTAGGSKVVSPAPPRF
jgi:ABC-type branched-subunit amino acid transport system substrate-binding protein